MQKEGYQKISVSVPTLILGAAQDYAKRNRYSVSAYITRALEEDLTRRGLLPDVAGEESLMDLIRAAKDEGIDVEILIAGAMRQKKGAA